MMSILVMIPSDFTRPGSEGHPAKLATPVKEAMALNILRALFVLLMAAVGWHYINVDNSPVGGLTWLLVAFALIISVFILCLDILSPRKKLAIFSAGLFGIAVGLMIAYALSFVVSLLVDQYYQPSVQEVANEKLFALFLKKQATLVSFIDLLVGVSTCYLSISFILQTKDDFRFIIPYVEFSKQTKGARPMLLDTSVLIDGRIGEVAGTGILESQLIVPRFIQAELQRLADSSDKMIRARGRRGLDILLKLQAAGKPEVIEYDSSGRDSNKNIDEDEHLLVLAKELNGRILTNDYNLNKMAQLRGVDVINLNELANAMKPEAMPGEKMNVRLMKEGDQSGQGVGYLDDGTMVVVDKGAGFLDQDVEFTVTNTRQTVQGRMIFGRMSPDAMAPSRRSGQNPSPRPRPDAQSSQAT
jgi:uncharacterized protein YacL